MTSRLEENLGEITLVSEPSAKHLNERQQLDYREERKRCIKWLLAVGKDPDYAEGYALGTIRPGAARMDQFYRWVWNQEGGYTTEITHDHADEYLDELAYEDTSGSHKNNCLKSLKRLFKWRRYEFDEEPWEPERRFKQENRKPRDYFSLEERRKLKQATLEYGAVPHYNSLSAGERDRWKAYLAQRFEMPKSEVTQEEFDRANSWKIPSLIWTSMDAGFRPIEVKRSRVQWIDLENRMLRIPMKESSKNRDNWEVALTEKTVQMLRRWLEEREQYEKYEGRDAIWLTREGNPYDKYSIRYVLRKLCEVAGIETKGRMISGYAIRHSTGTYVTNKTDLKTTADQLRQTSIESAAKYSHSPVEERRKHLETID